MRSSEDTHTWETWSTRWRWYAKLTLIVGSGSSLPPTNLPFTKHMFGVSMGYTCSSFTLGGLARKMRRAEKEAGV